MGGKTIGPAIAALIVSVLARQEEAAVVQDTRGTTRLTTYTAVVSGMMKFQVLDHYCIAADVT